MKNVSIIFGIAIFVCVLAWMPDKYKPAWSQRLNSWQIWIGLVALIIAVLIILNPDLYFLGLLGDSTFFDILVLAITCQLQVTGTKMWSCIDTGIGIAKKFIIGQINKEKLAFRVLYAMILLSFSDIFSVVQKLAHRISS